MKRWVKYSAGALAVTVGFVLTLKFYGEALHEHTVISLGNVLFSVPVEHISYEELRSYPGNPGCNADMTMEEALKRVTQGSCAVDICEPMNSDIGALFDAPPPPPKDPVRAAKVLIAECKAAYQHYDLVQHHRTKALNSYIAVDWSIARGIWAIKQLGTGRSL